MKVSVSYVFVRGRTHIVRSVRPSADSIDYVSLRHRLEMLYLVLFCVRLPVKSSTQTPLAVNDSPTTYSAGA